MSISRDQTAEAGPRCPYFGTCGGCRLQDRPMSEQLALKEQRLIELLHEHGDVEPGEVLPALDGPHWHYRHRARLAVKLVPKKGGVLVGFREIDGRYVTDIDECPILAERASALIRPLKDLIGRMSISNRLPQVEVAVGDDCVALTMRHLDPLTDQDEDHLGCFEKDYGVSLFLQPAGPETVHSLHETTNEDLRYVLSDWNLRLAFGPLDFIQVNPEINRKLIGKAVELLEPQDGERIADLFCGLGNFSLPIASRGASVVGMENVELQVVRARENAEANQLRDRTEFYTCDLYAGSIGGDELGGFDKVLLDPPRSGAERVLSALPAKKISRIVYVSCNPATLAHDARILVREKGYHLDACGVVNMFPHTLHAEAIALFT